jgi:hypothetical protein
MFKKMFLLFLLLLSCLQIAYAGEIVETPQDIVINDPTTHHVELLDIRFFYSDTDPYAVLSFNIVTDSGDFVVKHAITLTGTAFTDLISGFGGTLKTRANSNIWSFIQSNYTTQAIP